MRVVTRREGAVSVFKRMKMKVQSPERADSILAHFRKHGFSQTQIAKCVRSLPQLLNSDFQKTLLPKLEYFTSVGVSAEDIVKIVASTPVLLSQSLEKQIIPNHKLLRSMLPHQSVDALLRRDLRIFMANNSTSVLPNIRLLRQVGMSQSCISMSLLFFSRLVILNLKHQSFAQLVGEAKEMEFDMKNSTSLWAMGALWCKSTFNRNRQVFIMRGGWSEDNVLSGFRMRPRPQIMLVLEKKLMQVMEFLVNKMGFPSVTIAIYPAVFTYSLEKRIIPRCSVYKVLSLKGLINDNLSLLKLMRLTEEQFLEMFVTKFVNQIPQLMSVYRGNLDLQDLKRYFDNRELVTV